ncbi:hypothetical protein ABE65_010395 [Fictibacillus phosphorivorans]|uniref:Uncharacterized protein n=1 Tax=Fictibacillus phosphorivorans TaxID=1221500 RepID=A0A168W031_9BACL|nr:hypothetical protein [Fictibacillus phosphorivorans]ANC77189.1 hypothetical protein ABE65_010395 [Fictibacillus phosphorivorans]
MKKVLIIVGILIMMAITNPDKTEFVIFAEGLALNKSEGFIEEVAAYLFAEKTAEIVTESQNYVIFSIYTLPGVDGKDINFIGLFDNFFPIGSVNINLDTVVGFCGTILLMLILLRVVRKMISKDEIDEEKNEIQS